MIQDYTNYVSSNEFLNKNSGVKTVENNFDYNSFYRAYVVDNNDPEKLGRVKIRIPEKNVRGTFYPWAYPACFAGLGFQTGMFVLPPVGSIVFITFEYSDDHRPIYFGGIPTRFAPNKTQRYGAFINGGQARTVNDDDLPIEYTGTQQIVYKAPNGSILYFDSSDINNLVVLKNAFGSRFKIANINNVENGDINGYIEMAFDDRNYFRIKNNEFHLIINGEEVNVGGGGGGGTTEDMIITMYRISGISRYSENNSYTVGDYVYYGTLIYKCISDTYQEPFDNEKWVNQTYIQYLNDAQGIGYIEPILATLTLPTNIEQELSQI